MPRGVARLIPQIVVNHVNHEWLLKLVAGFLKISICNDVETWGQERYHLVSVEGGYIRFYIYIWQTL